MKRLATFKFGEGERGVLRLRGAEEGRPPAVGVEDREAGRLREAEDERLPERERAGRNTHKHTHA